MTAIQPYTGIRILDLTHRYGVYAGRLFADLGAEVIRVEPPRGLPDRTAGGAFDAKFAFFNASKKSVVVDLDTPAGRADFDRLRAGAQMILVERDGPLFDEIADLQKAAPALVIAAISPFGMTGPLAEAPASDLVLQAAGGIAWMSGRIDDAPLALPLDQATMVGSVYMATVAAIALADSEATGEGHLIDVSVQECIAHSLQNAIQVLDLEDRISIRGGEGTRDATEDIFPCRDGHVFLASPLALGNAWQQLVAWMREIGHPAADALSEDRWSSREWRLTREARDEFRRAFSTFSMNYTKAEMAHEAVSRRIVLGHVNRVSDLAADPQLVHRDFFVDVAGNRFPGAPYRLSKPVWRPSAAPALGADDALEGDAA